MKNDSQPNILFVICHDLGQYLSCYGAPLDTPRLDRLAAEGVRFENSFCSAAQCSPSRGSIMTGRSPHANGLMGLAHIGWEIKPGIKKLPEYLRESGYEARLFGVQHESADPETLGYDVVHRFPKDARLSTAAAAEWLRAYAAGDKRKPFHLSVGFFEPHRPYPDPDKDTGFDTDNPAEVVPLPYLPDRPGIRRDLAGLQGMIRRVDQCVGQLLDTLDETGLAEHTLVLFTTDHGIAMPRAKGTCYDPGVKVALLMRLPGRFPAGTVKHELLPNLDLLPTLVELAGGRPPEGLEGRSFLPLLSGGDYRPREHVFCEMTWHDRYNPMRAVRSPDFKYVRNYGKRPPVYLPADIFVAPAGREMRREFYKGLRASEELYDLHADPLEKNNLAADPVYRTELQRLRKLVDDWMRETADPLLKGDVPPTDEQWLREAGATVSLTGNSV